MVAEKRDKKDDYVVRIKRQLGYPVVQIEMTDEHVTDAIDTALDTYAATVGVKKIFVITASNGVSTYDLSNITQGPGGDPLNIDDVIDLQYVPTTDVAYYGYGMYEVPGYPFNNLINNAADYDNIRRNVETSRQLFGAVVDWQYDRVARKLYLKLPESSATVSIEYTNGDRLTVDDIKASHKSVFFDLCVAYAKKTLGLIRRKYEGAKLPGGEVKLDGQALYDEGDKAVTEISDKLIGMGNLGIIQG